MADTSGVEVDFPVRDRALDTAGLLSSVAGSFLYDFGTPGWPDGWSPMGLDPRLVGAELDGIPFEDPVTGAPVWELLPLAQIDPLETAKASRGRPDVVRARFRRDWPERPLTEMRYRSAGGGLQAVDVTHAQTRNVRGGSATVVLGYGGAGSTGEYAGSRLRRKRRLLGSLEFSAGRWTIGLLDLYNKNRVGAHGGVIPLSGFAYESIYERLLATVRNPSAERIRIRNDLVLSLSGPLAGRPLGVRAFRTNATLQYRAPSDTTTVRMERIGLVADWPFTVAGMPATLNVSAVTDAVRSGEGLDPRPDPTLTAQATVGVRKGFGDWLVDAGAGASSFDGEARPSARLAVGREAGPIGGRVSVVLAHAPRSAVEIGGFGPAFTGVGAAGPSRAVLLEGGVSARTGVLRLGFTAFARTLRDPVLLLQDDSMDSVRAVAGSEAVDARGITVSAGVRDQRPRGLYVEGSATWNAPLTSGSPDGQRATEAIPEIHGRARLGARAALFGGDLVVDLGVQARAWTAAKGLRLDAPTGLLVLPDPAARDLPGSAIVDVTADARIRSATVFLALENILSGTTLIVGNQLVPDYPWPERRFRFGVYWPIFD